MADNQANIQLNIEDSQVAGLIAELSRLSDTLGILTSDFNTMASKADNAAGELKDVDREAKRTDRSTSKLDDGVKKVGISFGSMAAGAGVATAAMVAMEAIKAGMRAGFELLKSSVEAFTEANDEMAGVLAGTSERMTEFKVSIGEAIIGGESGKQIFGVFNQVLSGLQRVVDNNREAIQTFVRGAIVVMLDAVALSIDYVGRYVVALNSLRLVFPLVRIGVVELSDAMIGLGIAVSRGFLDVIGDITSGLADFVDGIATLASRIPGVNVNLNGVSDSLRRINTSAGNTSEGLRQTREQLSASADAARSEWNAAASEVAGQNAAIEQSFTDASTAVSRLRMELQAGTTGDYAVSAPTDDGNANAAGNALVSGLLPRQLRENEFDAFMRENNRDLERLADNARHWEEGQLKAIEAINEQKLEQARKQNEEMLRIQESMEEKSLAMQERADEKRRQMLDDINAFTQMGLTTAFESSFMAIDGMDLEKGSKKVKKAIGDMLIAQGRQALLAGSLALIPPPFNPSGNPVAGATMIGIGGTMIGTGRALGGKGARGGKSSSPTPAQNVQAGSQTTINPTVSFGFVGDRRAAQRDVQDAVQRANNRSV
jgi:hypothetical protein